MRSRAAKKQADRSRSLLCHCTPEGWPSVKLARGHPPPATVSQFSALYGSCLPAFCSTASQHSNSAWKGGGAGRVCSAWQQANTEPNPLPAMGSGKGWRAGGAGGRCTQPPWRMHAHPRAANPTAHRGKVFSACTDSGSTCGLPGVPCGTVKREHGGFKRRAAAQPAGSTPRPTAVIQSDPWTIGCRVGPHLGRWPRPVGPAPPRPPVCSARAAARRRRDCAPLLSHPRP